MTQPGAKNMKVPTPVDLTYYGAIVLGPVMFLTCCSIAILHNVL
jgi:hypothetical protein